MVILHDASTYQSIVWSEKVQGEYVRDYVTPFFEQGVSYMVDNIDTSLYLLETERYVLPVTVNAEEYDNSYVCSPYTHYVSYAQEELWELKKPILEKMLHPLISGLGHLLKKGKINRTVMVNNWFLSTNLYHPLTDEEIGDITSFLVKSFPSHTIAFRSLNHTMHSSMMQSLQRRGYMDIMSRSIYLFDPKRFETMNKKKRKNIRTDKKAFVTSEFSVKNVLIDDKTSISRINALYRSLYIEKYSVHNPQFTDAFFEQMMAHRLMDFHALQKNGIIEGVIGTFERNGVLTTPILGYDVQKDETKKKGMYRLLTYLITDKLLEKNVFGHRSAGAGAFKRARGAEQEIEYTLVYARHLPFRQQFPWKFLQWIMTRYVLPMAKDKGF